MTHQTDELNNNFTLLRLMLAFMVVFGHFKLLVAGINIPPFPFNMADAAVYAFFVVSGFLITMSFERSHGLWPFYVRRVFRLYPMYVCIVVLQALDMIALLPGGPFSDPHSVARYLAVNLMMANFLQYDIGGVLTGLHNPGINPSLWTLKIEIGFYLIVPLIVVATRRWGWKVLALIFAASVAYSLAMLHFGDLRMAKQLPGQLQYFVIGMALYLYGADLRMPLPLSAAVVVAFPVAWTWLHPDLPVIGPLVVGAFVYTFAFCMPTVRLNRDVSYSVYLVHAPLIQTLVLLGVARDDTLFLIGTLCGVLGLSAVTERLVERPGNALGHRLSRRFGRKAAVA